MVGMGMGDQHGIKPGHPGGQKLGADIRAWVDQQPRSIGGLDQRRGAGAAVARLLRVACAPIAGLVITADIGHAGRWAGAEEAHPQIHAALA